MKKTDLVFGFLRLPVDFCMLLTAGLASYLLRTSPWLSAVRPVLFYGNLPFGTYIILVFGAAISFVVIFALIGLYPMEKRQGLASEAFGIIVALSAGMAGFITLMFFERGWFDSRFILLAAWILAIFFVAMGRWFLRFLRWYLRRKFRIGQDHVVLVGRGERVEIIKEAIGQARGMTMQLRGIYAPDSLPSFKELRGLGCDHIILTDSDFSQDRVAELVNFCQENHIRFSFVPDTFVTLAAQMQMDILGGMPVIELKRTPLDGWGKIVKRCADVCLATFGLVVLSSVFAVVSLAITRETKGPIFVRLKRVSQGKNFYLFKFRSMVDNAEELKPFLAQFNERPDGPLFKMHDDPRITKVGKILRAGRFDELPQLFNVLRGEMSLVGPRPHEPQEVAQYQAHHHKVFAIKPGITGLAQTSGAADLPFEEEVKLDSYYVEHWSLAKDIAILAKTLGMLLFDRSGY